MPLADRCPPRRKTHKAAAAAAAVIDRFNQTNKQPANEGSRMQGSPRRDARPSERASKTEGAVITKRIDSPDCVWAKKGGLGTPRELNYAQQQANTAGKQRKNESRHEHECTSFLSFSLGIFSQFTIYSFAWVFFPRASAHTRLTKLARRKSIEDPIDSTRRRGRQSIECSTENGSDLRAFDPANRCIDRRSRI